MRDVTDSTFVEEVLKNPLPVFVDFWAEWCLPCHRIHPILEQLQTEYEGRIEIVRINADVNPEATRALLVMSLPTVIAFKNGKVVHAIVGAQPKKIVQQFIEDSLNTKDEDDG